MAAAESPLPPREIVDEILRRYADVLRVGCVAVNGEAVRWGTDTSTERQLRGFSEAFFAKLRGMPELANLSDDVLKRAAYWFCKAVSINYALMEVLLLIKEKVGAMCTIETRDDEGGLVTYSADVSGEPPSQVMRVRMAWRSGNNIVYRDPLSSEKKVKGTISCLETEFGLPPPQKFAPAYRLQMKLKKSLAQRFARKVGCGHLRTQSNEQTTMILEEPLRSPLLPHLVLAPADGGSALEQLVGGGSSSSCAPPAAEEGVRLPGAAFVRQQPAVGRLRVTVVRLRRPSSVEGLGGGASHEDGGAAGEALAHRRRRSGALVCCRCCVAGAAEQTRWLPPGSAPGDWSESWDFPLHAHDLRGDLLVELLGGSSEDAEVLLGQARAPISVALLGGGHEVRTVEQLDPSTGGEVELRLQFVAERCPEEDGGTAREATGTSAEGEECDLEFEITPPAALGGPHASAALATAMPAKESLPLLTPGGGRPQGR